MSRVKEYDRLFHFVAALQCHYQSLNATHFSHADVHCILELHSLKLSSSASSFTVHVFVPQLFPSRDQISACVFGVELVEIADFEWLADALDADRVEPPHCQSSQER